ncbi:MAG TPA: hypothetical protein PKC43_12005 [Phycisphaerales bacterium]|nr:hypothetical protein [Phycisphaerales bacterium]HMP38155.1 hypothetical protein [Phycisphaerales bacterium]
MSSGGAHVSSAEGSRRASAPAQEGSAWRVGLVAACVYLVCAAAWLLAASALWEHGFRAGVVVSDAVSWHRNFALVTEENPLRLARPGVFFLAFYRVSPHLNTLLNALLVASSIALTAVATQRAVGGAGGLRAARFVAFSMALMPWLWIVTPGPTKEPFALPAVAASILFVVDQRARTFLLALVFLAVLCIARVEQAIMLLGIMGIAIAMQRTAKPRLLLLGTACGALAVGVVLFWAGEAWLGYRTFFNLSPQLWPLKSTQVEGPEARIGELGRWLSEKGWYDPFWNIFALGYRLAANLLGTVLRMGVVTTSGVPSILGIGQALAGFIVFAGFVATALRLRRGDDRLATLLGLHLGVIWIGASMVAFVQPRYILVELPVALVALATTAPALRRAVLGWTLAGALAIRGALALAGMGIPSDRPLEDDRPPFLLLSAPAPGGPAARLTDVDLAHGEPTRSGRRRPRCKISGNSRELRRRKPPLRATAAGEAGRWSVQEAAPPGAATSPDAAELAP